MPPLVTSSDMIDNIDNNGNSDTTVPPSFNLKTAFDLNKNDLTSYMSKLKDLVNHKKTEDEGK